MKLHEISNVFLTEMANLNTMATGIESGHIWVSTKYDNHGCRIKFYPNLSNRSIMLTVTIPDFKIVDDTIGPKVSARIKKEVVVFAIKNQTELLDFWNNGTEWDQEQLTHFLNNFKKIEPKDYTKIEQLRFK